MQKDALIPLSKCLYLYHSNGCISQAVIEHTFQPGYHFVSGTKKATQQNKCKYKHLYEWEHCISLCNRHLQMIFCPSSTTPSGAENLLGWKPGRHELNGYKISPLIFKDVVPRQKTVCCSLNFIWLNMLHEPGCYAQYDDRNREIRRVQLLCVEENESDLNLVINAEVKVVWVNL